MIRVHLGILFICLPLLGENNVLLMDKILQLASFHMVNTTGTTVCTVPEHQAASDGTTATTTTTTTTETATATTTTTTTTTTSWKGMFTNKTNPAAKEIQKHAFSQSWLHIQRRSKRWGFCLVQPMREGSHFLPLLVSFNRHRGF